MKKTKYLLLLLGIFLIFFFGGISTTKAVNAQAEGPPFVGCVDNGDWLCMCYYNGQYLRDCANYESQPKKDYIALCGDATKGEAQWRYDVSMGFTGKGDCCKGQNVCRPTPIPIPPTEIPQPTEPPEPLATDTPYPEPTTILRTGPNEAHPTINAFPTTEPIASSPQFEFPSINLPTFNLPKIQIDLPKINQLARKPLDLFEYLFKRIVYYDNVLENTINTNFKRIITK